MSVFCAKLDVNICVCVFSMHVTYFPLLLLRAVVKYITLIMYYLKA